jgi:rhamnose utilization protein RhaD (predicted bifunctional aldolase and dehydrogenase)
MKSAWTDQEAEETVAQYAPEGVNQDLALRLFTTRLLGRDPLLVLHGGGNTSVKTTVTDLLGEDTEVLCVKGSGWDMAEIEPPGLPAVRMEPLLRLRTVEVLSDEDMVSLQRGALVDPSSPNPSVETLLHAFLPTNSWTTPTLQRSWRSPINPSTRLYCRRSTGTEWLWWIM